MNHPAGDAARATRTPPPRFSHWLPSTVAPKSPRRDHPVPRVEPACLTSAPVRLCVRYFMPSREARKVRMPIRSSPSTPREVLATRNPQRATTTGPKGTTEGQRHDDPDGRLRRHGPAGAEGRHERWRIGNTEVYSLHTGCAGKSGWRIAQVDDGGADMEKQVQAGLARYIHGTQYIDEVVMMRAAGRGDLYIHQAEGDQGGSPKDWNVIAATDLGGNVVERYSYTPYGELFVDQLTSWGDRDGDSDVDATDKGTPGTTCTTLTGACRILDLDFDGDYDANDATLFDALDQGLARHPGRSWSGVGVQSGWQGLLSETTTGRLLARNYECEPRIPVILQAAHFQAADIFRSPAEWRTARMTNLDNTQSGFPVSGLPYLLSYVAVSVRQQGNRTPLESCHALNNTPTGRRNEGWWINRCKDCCRDYLSGGSSNHVQCDLNCDQGIVPPLPELPAPQPPPAPPPVCPLGTVWESSFFSMEDCQRDRGRPGTGQCPIEPGASCQCVAVPPVLGPPGSTACCVDSSNSPVSRLRP